MASIALLLDVNLPPSLVDHLRRRGISADHAHDRTLGRASDEQIVEHARQRGDVVVTHDLDFSRILAESGSRTPSVIIMRLRQPTLTSLASMIEVALQRAATDLAAGAIVVVEDAAIRVRPLPVAGGEP